MISDRVLQCGASRPAPHFWIRQNGLALDVDQRIRVGAAVKVDATAADPEAPALEGVGAANDLYLARGARRFVSLLRQGELARGLDVYALPPPGFALVYAESPPDA